MKKFFTLDIIVSLILILSLFTFLKGPELLMPMTANSMALVLFVALFAVFVGLIFRESSSDEREKLHKLEAGRIAYLVGISVITLGIVIQSFSYDIDPWLFYALISMIIVKIAARIYAQLRH
jgi:hypothetical protein